MTTYTQQQLEERYKKLPDVLKEAMFSVDISQKLFEIGKKFGLTIEHIGFMADEAGYVVLGLTPPTMFVKHLMESLDIDIEKAKSIAAEINHQIFFPLRESLKQTHQIEITEEAIQNGEPFIREPMVKKQTETALPKTPPPEAPKPIVQEKQKTIEEERKEAVWNMITKNAQKPVAPPISPEPPTSKIPPIDLRKTVTPTAPEKPATPKETPKPFPIPPPATAPNAKTEMMLGGGIFAAPPERELEIKNKEVGKPTPLTAPPPPTKKIPQSGTDPYREPIE